MNSKTVSFRLELETYIKIEVIAAEKGLSPGAYIKETLENDHRNFMNDMQLMQSDIKDILQKLQIDTLKTDQGINDNILIEILLILREIATPTKLNSAQKKANALGYKTINTLE